MNTNDIFESILVVLLDQAADHLSPTLNFEVWNDSFNNISDSLLFYPDIDVKSLKNDAKRVLMLKYVTETSKLSKSIEKWDRDYDRRKYGFLSGSLDFIYYPSINPKRIVISFSSMGKDKYDRYSHYWD